MACSERWLFRMWRLHLFLVAILIVTQNIAAEEQNSPKVLTNNETIPPRTVLNKNSKTAESAPASVLEEAKNEILSSESSPLNDVAKPVAVDPTKPPKEMVTNQTLMKAAENVPNVPQTNNSSISETAKPLSSINDKQQTSVMKDPKFSLNSTSAKNEEKPVVVAKNNETKSEPGKVPAVTNISDKNALEPTQEADTSKTAANKVPQAPILSQPNKDGEGQLPEELDDTEDIHNTPITNTELDYEGGDDIDGNDTPPKIDDTLIEHPAEEKSAGESVASKDESKPQTYHPKHAIGSNEFDDGDSHFFIYFLTVVGMCIVMYVLFHNKQKILALIVEGRQERRRRPNTSQYRPLDNNLEEVIQAGTPKNGRLTTNIIY